MSKTIPIMKMDKQFGLLGMPYVPNPLEEHPDVEKEDMADTYPERRRDDPRVVRLEGRLDGHEILCAERYRNIQLGMDFNAKGIASIYKIIWGAAIASIGVLLTGFGAMFWMLFGIKHIVN